jgi:F-type H+-transporting ATPase subunit gamma
MQHGKLYDMKLPDKNTSNSALYELYLTANIYVGYLQNQAAYTSAKMQAMDNASKNAGEMLDTITLQYNKARQQRITTELCEIIGGVTAL